MSDRKTPKQRRSQELVDSVLTATSVVASREGIEAATLSKISEKAGVSPGSIYQYFSNKDSILGESVIEELKFNREVVLDKMREWGPLPLNEFVRNMIYAVGDLFQARYALSRHIFTQSQEVGKIDEHMAMRREVIKALSRVLNRHRDELEFPDIDQVSTIIVHSVIAAYSAPMVDKTLPYSVDSLKENVFQMVIRFLAPRTTNASGNHTP